MGELKKTIVSIVLCLYYFTALHAFEFAYDHGNTLEGGRIAWPQYYINKTSTKRFGPAYTILKENFNDCEVSTRTYQKQNYIGDTENFPLVPRTPSLQDSLAVLFFKDLKRNEFLTSRWGHSQKQAVLYLYLSKETNPQYRQVVERAVKYIQDKAQLLGLSEQKIKLVELSAESVSLSDESCDINIIHFEQDLTASFLDLIFGYNIKTIDIENDERLGEIRDADIIIYPGNLIKAHQTFNAKYTALSEEEQKKLIDNQLFAIVLHEIMHALGLEHNFALGTAVDYEGLYDQSNRNMSLEYEIEVLSFLYLLKEPSQAWPLIRTKSHEDTFFVHEQFNFKKDQLYKSQAKQSSMKFFCYDKEDRRFDFSKHLNESFQLEFLLEANQKPYVDFKSIRWSMSEIFKEDTGFGQSVFTFIKQGRLLPVMKADGLMMDELPEASDNSRFDKIELLPHSIWILANSPFIKAYQGHNSQTSMLHLKLKTKDGLECLLDSEFYLSIQE